MKQFFQAVGIEYWFTLLAGNGIITWHGMAAATTIPEGILMNKILGFNHPMPGNNICLFILFLFFKLI